MRDRTQFMNRILACWPLVLLALMARLSFGGLVSPQAALDDPVARVAALSLLCDSQHVGDGTPHDHVPSDMGDGIFLLGDALDNPAPAFVAFALLFLTFCVPCAHVWCFPPVRGPPLRRVASLYPQGPPV
ncbi:hypothetical protein HK28_08175 [Acetobacter sp. DsW_063]|nr:hypothetical protein HK28_08175 [Acetobacter sp. DsW_063]